MKALVLICLGVALTLPAMATVSIEFQFGGVEAPAGSIGVLVADTADNEFTSPSDAPGAVLSVGQTIGADDKIIAVLSPSGLADWGVQKGFAEQLAILDYAALGLAEGDGLILHIFPDRGSGDSIRSGEPHLSYRAGDFNQLTANSSMGFALPADGGAYLLAALAPGNGGNADLSGIDITGLPYDTGAGGFNRSLSQSARHTYFFHLAQPGFLTLEGIGGAALRAELYGPDGQLVAESSGGPFEFYEELVAGFHSLVLYQSAGSGNLPYGLAFTDTDGRTVIPDVSVGRSLSSLIGGNILGGAPGQLLTLTSAKARRVSGYATVANRGLLSDTLAVRGTGGNALCGIAYFDAVGNVTAGLVSGAYRTSGLDSGDPAASIRVQFTPNTKKLVTKKGRRTLVKRRLFSAQVRASSTVGPPVFDAATLRAQTR